MDRILVGGSSVLNHGTLCAATGGSLRLAALEPNAGILDAGAGGVIRIDGDFTNAALGTVRIAVLGDQPSQYGRVEVDGTVHLGGTLDIKPGGGLAPDYALSLPILSYGAADNWSIYILEKSFHKLEVV